MSTPSPTLAVRRSRWIPWAFVGGFGVVVAVNAVLIVFALTSWSGLETEQAYQKGLAYNETLDEAAEQAARSWQATLGFASTGERVGELSLELADRDRRPIGRLSVVARLMRPTVTGYDQAVELRPQANGRYAATIALPLAGQWRVDVEAVGLGAPYKLTERIMVR